MTDAQVGMMNKYGAMSLGIRRLEDGLSPAKALGGGSSPLLVHAATAELSEKSATEIATAMEHQTVVLGGRADRLHPDLATACGVHVDPPPGSPIGCEVAAVSRLNCGFSGVTKQQCEQRGCCYDDTQPAPAPWCFEPSTIAKAGFVLAAFADPLPAELTAEMYNLSLPRRMGSGLDGTAGVIVNVPCSDPIMSATQSNTNGAVVNGSGCVWWQPPDWENGAAAPQQLSQDRYGSAAMHAAAADVLRQRAAVRSQAIIHL